MPAITINRIAAIFFVFVLSCSTAKHTTAGNDILPASSLHPIGRYALNDQGLEMITTAVHFGFSFSGTECNIVAFISNPNGHNYLQYELDGVYQKRIRVNGNTKQPIPITATSSGRHTVWIYKATEAQTGPVFVEKITGKDLKALENPNKPVIEFIGNSITCGAAADPSEVPCGKGEYQDQHNAYYAYGPRVARSLGVNYVVSSVSGIGVYRNWNSDGPAMPAVYENADMQNASNRPWNFNLFKPAIVSIALGTNDFSNGDGRKARLPFDSATFVNTYIKFIQTIKSKYSGIQLVLLSSPMVNGSRRVTFQNCLTALKGSIDALYPSDKPVALFFFEPMQARGCSGHPNVEDHAILAEQLLHFFKKLL